MRLRRAALLLNPGFLRFAWRRFRAAMRELVQQFEQSQTGDVDSLMYSLNASVTNYSYLRRDPTSYVWPDASLVTPEQPCVDETGIYLGEATYVGRRARMEIETGNRIEIGAYSRINDNCALHGDVRISRHCLLASNIHISSGTHQFRHRPTWLIADQDAEVAAHPDASVGAPVVIEEDCWIGWGVVILAGVYIGRGAVVGANAVVTRDIAPYSVHGGVPNRQISARLSFQPPTEVVAANDDHWPYFYSGFGLRRRENSEAQAAGLLLAQPKSRIVLAGGEAQQIRFRGSRHRTSQPLRIHVALNGANLGVLEITEDDFDESLALGSAQPCDGKSLPAPLREFNVVDLRLDGGEDPPREAAFGLSLVSLA